MTTPSDAGLAGEREVWTDRQGDLWTLGSDGLMHTPETAPDRELCCAPCLRDRILASDWLATQITVAEQRGREELRARIADLDARCARAEEQLRDGQAAHERNGFDTDAVRLSGKREGVALVRDYLREILRDQP